MGRVVIFCKTYNSVISIYQFFKQSLGEYFTDPIGAQSHISCDCYNSIRDED